MIVVLVLDVTAVYHGQMSRNSVSAEDLHWRRVVMEVVAVVSVSRIQRNHPNYLTSPREEDEALVVVMVVVIVNGIGSIDDFALVIE